MAARRKSFGSLRKLPSGRYQARYTAPDLVRHTAPLTFETKCRRRGLAGPEPRGGPRSLDRRGRLDGSLTFEEYATAWLADRILSRAPAATISHFSTPGSCRPSAQCR